MTDAERFIFDIGARGLTPDKRLTVSEWSDAFRILTTTGSAEPGAWRTSRTPYLREIMDALSVNSPYNTVVLQKASQVGASEMAVNFLGYIADVSPGPSLYLMPTVDAAKEFSKIRIDPLVSETETLKDKVKDPRARDSGNTTLLKEFTGGYWALTGANSSVGLRSKPIRFLILDEIDAYPGSIAGEGDPVSLTLARARTYGNRRKVFAASSPTIAGESRIEQMFESTDKRYYHVPCPHCNHYQILLWPRIKWRDDDPETAYYECDKCEEPIYNHDKTTMLESGKWISTATGATAGASAVFLACRSRHFAWPAAAVA